MIYKRFASISMMRSSHKVVHNSCYPHTHMCHYQNFNVFKEEPGVINVVGVLHNPKKPNDHYLGFPHANQTLAMAVESGKSNRLELLRQLAGTLFSIHKSGYVHLDIKPSNIVVLLQTATMIDFESLTPIGTAMKKSWGTFTYRGKDIWDQQDPRHAEISIDVFALGMTFLFIFTGSKLRDVLDENHASLKDQLEDILAAVQPRSVQTLLEAMVRQQASKRPNTWEITNQLVAIAGNY
jgi:serine/threonine protein kinase